MHHFIKHLESTAEESVLSLDNQDNQISVPAVHLHKKWCSFNLQSFQIIQNRISLKTKLKIEVEDLDDTDFKVKYLEHLKQNNFKLIKKAENSYDIDIDINLELKPTNLARESTCQW